MNKSVIISVKGNQLHNDERDSIELVTEGKYYKKGENYFVTYRETEMTGMEGTTTTLKIEGNKVTLMRFGVNNSQLIFEKGQKHVCYYETQFGGFTVGVHSNEVSINLDDNGGNVSAEYQLEIDNASAGENDFYLQIREANLTHDKFSGSSERPDQTSH